MQRFDSGPVAAAVPAAIAMACFAAFCPADDAAADTAAERARQIVSETGVRGGLVVHLGGGDGKLTAALRVNASYVVQGLEADPDAVSRARDLIASLGLDGNVTIDAWRGGRLPYVDHLVNLLVVSEGCTVDDGEMLRVLAPNGVACVERDGAWSKTVKPWPDDIDQWTHYQYDATGNAVARDAVVGPPRHSQWIGTPAWLRHHDHLSGFSAMVSAGGRIFYIVDLGPRWSVQMPPKWTLIARDAFNGTVLWERSIKTWHAHLWPLKRGPAGLMRRLVAQGDTVYVTLGVGEPVTALDAATGRIVRTYEGTEGAEEILLAEGTLFVLVNPELDAYKTLPRDSVDTLRRAGAHWNWDEKPRHIAAIDARTGSRLWDRASRVAPITLAAAGDRVYFHDGDRVVCLDAESGRDRWASKPVPRWKPMHVLFGPTLVAYGDVVLFAGGENMDPIRGGDDTMTAMSAETGDVLWTAPHPTSGYASAEDLFVVDGLVWCGATTNRRDSGVFTGRDVRTGEVRREFAPDDWPHMPHHRCHRAKATCNYILTSRTGIEFVDFRSEHWAAHHWVRGACNYGIMPCNGLLYAPPHSCACYPLAKLNAFNALAPESPSRRVPIDLPDDDRLVRGPAYEAARALSPGSPGSRLDDWPTYRGDAARSGSTAIGVPAELDRLWAAEIGGKLTSPVIAGGKVVVGAVDRHTVHALDASSGKRLWRFTAGARVDSPPTIWRDRVLFGSADGYVYCLRAADGATAWRFRAAPIDRRLMACEQIESVWPVHGSVLVHEGVVYCVAGRSMWLDGGMRLVRLDARSGRKLSETVLDDRYPGTDETLQRDVRWPNLPVALPDVLSCDGRHVYMRSQPFDLDGNRTEVVTPRDYTEQRGTTAHLFSPTGFLDDSWWHRSYWLFGRSFIGGAGGWYLAGYRAPSGRILAVDDATVYGFGRVPLGLTGTPNRYHLFACAKEPGIINPHPNQPPRKQGASIFGPVVPTRLDYHWSRAIPFLGRALVAAGDTLFVAGPPIEADELEVYALYGEEEVQRRMAEHVAAFEGRKGGRLMAVAKRDGAKQAAYRLESPPVFDGMAAAGERLYLSTLDGKVLCLGRGEGQPLESAPEVEPGPVPAASAGFVETRSHPDFQHLAAIGVGPSELGYRMQTAPREVGLALRRIEPPLTRQAVFRVRVRPNPGAPSPDTPGNGFVAFGDGPADEQLVKCGFRISGKRLFIVQGPLAGGRSVSRPIDVKANEVAEICVTVDLEAQKVAATMLGATVEASLERKLDAVAWVGCCLTSVTTEFSPIEVRCPE